jgi:hypothetical protein
VTTDITATLNERGQRYGKFTEHAEVTQQLKGVIRIYLRRRPVGTFDADQQEALDMICHKIGRIICGDPDYADSWHDIAGYAQLVADRLNGVER